MDFDSDEEEDGDVQLDNERHPTHHHDSGMTDGKEGSYPEEAMPFKDLPTDTKSQMPPGFDGPHDLARYNRKVQKALDHHRKELRLLMTSMRTHEIAAKEAVAAFARNVKSVDVDLVYVEERIRVGELHPIHWMAVDWITDAARITSRGSSNASPPKRPPLACQYIDLDKIPSPSHSLELWRTVPPVFVSKRANYNVATAAWKTAGQPRNPFLSSIWRRLQAQRQSSRPSPESENSL